MLDEIKYCDKTEEIRHVNENEYIKLYFEIRENEDRFAVPRKKRAGVRLKSFGRNRAEQPSHVVLPGKNGRLSRIDPLTGADRPDFSSKTCIILKKHMVFDKKYI